MYLCAMFSKSTIASRTVRHSIAKSPKPPSAFQPVSRLRSCLAPNSSLSAPPMPATRVAGPCIRSVFVPRPSTADCPARHLHTTPHRLAGAPVPHALRMVIEPVDEGMIEQELQYWTEHSELTLQVLHFHRIYGANHVLIFRVGSIYEMYGTDSHRWAEKVERVEPSTPGAIAIAEDVFYEQLCKLVFVYGQRVALFGQLVGNENAVQRATAKSLGSSKAVRGSTKYLQQIFTPGTFVAFEDITRRQLGAQYMSSVSLAAIYIPALHSPSASLPTNPPLPLHTPIYITITDRLTFNTDQVSTTLADFTRTLQGLCPSEIIVPPHYLTAPTVVTQHFGNGHAPLSSFIPGSDQCITQRPLADFVPRIHACDRNGTVGGLQSDEFQITRHAIMEYLDYVHVGSRVPDVAPSQLLDGKHAIVPRPTAAHLELFRTARRRSEMGTVISFMDETYLRAGRQVLRRAMMLPYLRLNDIDARASRVELLKNDEKASEVVTGWMQHLMRWADLESIINQITSDAATLPALYALRHHLSTFNRIRPKLEVAPAFKRYDIPDVSSTFALVNRSFDFSAIEQGLDSDDSFTEQEIDVVPPIVLQKDSDPTYVAHIDMGKKLTKKAKQIQDQFTRYIEFEGEKEGRKPYFRSAVVVSQGQDKADIMGYVTRAVIDVPATDWQRVPESKKGGLTVVGTSHGDRLVSVLYEPWNRVQDLILKQRRITRKLEKDLIRQALDDLAQVHAPVLHSLAALIAEADLTQSLILVADKYSCTRAVVPPTSAPRKLRIQNGFHPILYKVRSILDSPRRVVPIDLELSDDRSLCILSGANMSGKSTVLRTVGVTAIMSQLGSYVPAKSSPTSVPIFDAVFTRFGAVDDLSRNMSTFHIEIMELGEILRKATPNSLVLIDELGRGTSIEDGTALACAIVRELLNRRTTTLITTHFLDLERLLRKHLTPSEFERVVFLQTESELVDDDPVEAARNKARDGDDIYVPPVHVEQRYRLIPGMAKASHGLEVAKTADLPRRLLSDAFKVRELIEAQEALRLGQD